MLPFYEIQTKDLRLYRRTRQLSFPAHMHSSIEIMYVFSGVQYVEIDGVPYAIHEGEAAFIFPDIVHRYERQEDQPVDAVLMICDPSRLFGAFLLDFNSCYPATPIIPREAIHEEAVYALRHIRLDDAYPVQLGWIYIILSHLLRHMALKRRKRVPVQDMPYKIMEYVNNHFTEPMTLESIAAEFCVSKYYISHIFSDRIKMNFRQYLGLLRAEYAAKLIRASDASLTAISGDAGFDSQRTFNRVFRAHYGMSPKEFRNRSRIL